MFKLNLFLRTWVFRVCLHGYKIPEYFMQDEWEGNLKQNALSFPYYLWLVDVFKCPFHNVRVDPGLLAQVHVLMFGKTTTDTYVQALRHLHKIKPE